MQTLDECLEEMKQLPHSPSQEISRIRQKIASSQRKRPDTIAREHDTGLRELLSDYYQRYCYANNSEDLQVIIRTIDALNAVDNPSLREIPRLSTRIRWMAKRDMPEVLAIEKNSFEFPWTEEDFIHCLQQRNCIGKVSEFDERIAGFMIYELHKTRLHFLHFAVDAGLRRKGVGQAMVKDLFDKLSLQRRNALSLETRERNIAAQLFFKSMGFRAISILRNFYEDTDEDGYIMQYVVAPKEGEENIPLSRISKYLS